MGGEGHTPGKAKAWARAALGKCGLGLASRGPDDKRQSPRTEKKKGWHLTTGGENVDQKVEFRYTNANTNTYTNTDTDKKGMTQSVMCAPS